ncbi:unnamed protein product [Mytilus edulis]|uniref:Integrase catalytic domain-containing protein n=1 Tax=Mytilus edulis TaxID=6550 RepID=A0A8S3SZM4_MYTED|nr:unnamed protein product [Mytilus edulis]
MSFDDTIDEYTKQIYDMEEGTTYRNSFVSSTPKDQGVRPKYNIVSRNDSGLGSRGSSLSRKGDNEKVDLPTFNNPNTHKTVKFSQIDLKEGDTLPLPIDNSYIREKDKTDKSKYRHTDNTDNSGVKIKPCQYDGSTSWTDYLSHFEMCALVNNWSENRKGLYLAVSLMGQAQAVLGDLPSEKRQNFSDLVSALEERFAPSSQTELYRVQFKERRQKASESLPELGQSIRRLSNLAYPTAPLDVRETLGKEQFIDALVDSEMRLRIKQSRPKGLNDAVRLAVELEAYNKAENKVREGRGYLRQTRNDDELSREEKITNSDSTTKDIASWMQTMEKSLSTLTTEMAKLKSSGTNEGSYNSKTRYTQRDGTVKTLMKTRKQNNRKTNEGAVTTASEDAGMYVKLNVGDIEAKFVVDTGAILTLVSSKLYDMLTPLDKSYLSEVKTSVRSVCGTKLELRGKGRFNLHFGPNMLQSEAVVTDLQGSIGCYRVVASEAVVIPPRSEIVINGTVCLAEGQKLPADNALLEANEHAGKDYILTARTLVRSGEKVPVRLMNTELDPKTIYPGTTIAQMSGVEQVLDGNIGSNEQTHNGLRPDLQDLLDRTSDELTSKDKQKVKSLLIENQNLFASSDVDLGRTNLHRPGVQHRNADALSRIPCKQCGYHSGLENEIASAETENQHDNVNAITRFDSSNDRDDDSEDHDLSLKEIQNNDHDLKIVTKWVETDERPDYKDISDKEFFLRSLWNQWNNLEIRDGLIYRRFEDPATKIVKIQAIIPLSERKKVLQFSHDDKCSAHLGIHKTLAKIRQSYYWPGLQNDVRTYVNGCDKCAKRKSPQKSKRAPMALVEANGPMERIATDILGELPETESGNKYILVVSDYYTKWTESFAMPNMEAKTVAKIIVEEVIVRFGVPHWIHSDQGRQFESLLFQEMCCILNIKKTRTTPYHPKSDGMVERFNKTLATMLSSFVEQNQRDWDEYIPFVMMAYRASEHETTGQTPNSLMLGRELSTPLDIMYEMPPSVKDIPAHKWAWELKEKLEISHSFVRGKIKGQMRRQKHYHDLKLSYQNFRKDDEVYVYFPVKKPGMSSKLTSFWKGPFKILDKYGDLTYKVDCGYRGKPQVIHVDRLKKKNKQTLRTESDNNTFVPLDTENDTVENDPIETPYLQDIAVNESTLPVEETQEISVEGRRTRRKPAWMADYIVK